jgi:hypothetical protein
MFSDFHPQEISEELVAYLCSFFICESGAFRALIEVPLSGAEKKNRMQSEKKENGQYYKMLTRS